MARGRWVAVMVDGARMLSPGLLGWMQRAFRLEPQAFVTTLGWHLGEEPQNTAMTKGYNQVVEDRLLASFDWQTNGYRLFDHACLALSCRQGWFSSIAESNCFALPKLCDHSLHVEKCCLSNAEVTGRGIDVTSWNVCGCGCG